MSYYATRQVIKALDKLREEMKDLFQQQIGAVRDVTKATRENKQDQIPIPLRVTAETQPTPAEKTDQNSQNNKNFWLQVALTVGTWLAFLAAAIYAGIAAHQASLMNDTLQQIKQQTIAAEQSADAADRSALTAQRSERDTRLSNAIQSEQARKSLQATIDNFHQDQRPWVGFQNPDCEHCEGFTTENGFQAFAHNLTGKIANTGKTPAEEVRVSFTVHYGAFHWVPKECSYLGKVVKCPPGKSATLKFDPLGRENEEFVDIGVIAPGQSASITLTGPNWGDYGDLRNAGEMGLAAAEVEGTITYQLLWGGQGRTQFCFYPVYPTHAHQKNETYPNCDAKGSNAMN